MAESKVGGVGVVWDLIMHAESLEFHLIVCIVMTILESKYRLKRDL